MWNVRHIAPKSIERVYEDFQDFSKNGWNGTQGRNLSGRLFQADRSQEAKASNLPWFTHFSNRTIGDGICEIFNNWGEDDITRYDTLGICSRRYGVYKDKSFLIIMTMIIDGFKDNQGSIGK